MRPCEYPKPRVLIINVKTKIIRENRWLSFPQMFTKVEVKFRKVAETQFQITRFHNVIRCE